MSDLGGQLAAKTAAESELAEKSAGQRRVNILWEVTQATLAFMITGTAIYTAIAKIEAKAIDAAFVMIMTMYFMRTNSHKIGGVGGTDSR